MSAYVPLSAATANKEKPCDACGRTGQYKASAWRADKGERLFCHDAQGSCYNEARGNYFPDVAP